MLPHAIYIRLKIKHDNMKWVKGIEELDKKRRMCNMRAASCFTIFILVGILFAATNVVRWDTDIVFYASTDSDLRMPAGVHVPQALLISPEWRERRTHIVKALKEGCKQHGYAVVTHKNLRVYGVQVDEGFLYICPTDKGYLNAVVTSTYGKSILCRETYGSKTREVRRYPFTLRYTDARTLTNGVEEVEDPVLVCSIMHGMDVVESKFLP